MNQSTYYERKNLSAWPCQDVDVLYEKIAKVGSGTYGEVNKARLKADPSQFVALKKIKDQSETQGVPPLFPIFNYLFPSLSLSFQTPLRLDIFD